MMTSESNPYKSSSLGLLLRTNVLQAWRRLLSIRHQSHLLTFLISLFLVGYLGLAFGLFWKGLRFMGTFPGLGTLLVERLLYLLFAFLFVLLLLSNLVIGYTNFFRNRETMFLVSLPLRRSTVFQWKFIESALLASWAFLFLIAPLLVAYGMVHQVRWHFYIMTPLLVILFIVLPAVAGAWSALLIARYLDRRTFQGAVLLLLAGLLLVTALWLRPAVVTDEMLETRVLEVLDRLLLKTQFAQFPLLPSYWLSATVLNWSEQARGTALFYLLVLMSHVLFFGFLAFTSMGNMFYEGISAVQSRGGLFQNWIVKGRHHATPGFHYRPGMMERLIAWIPFLRLDVRALLVKDIRMFWRDTAQWGQTLVLFGLLGVYILNLRHFSHQLTNAFWINLVSFMNLLACSLNLATLTTRFIYPQFSQEGKRIWVIGLAPLGLPRILKAKFGLASGAALIVTAGLMGLSCQMLQIPWHRTLFFIGAVTVMTFSLTGLAVGLGALYPNFKEDHPGKIVSGFGGTFCLVLSFLYILSSVALLAAGSPWMHPGGIHWGTVALSWSAFALLSILAGWIPLRLGLGRVARFELS